MSVQHKCVPYNALQADVIEAYCPMGDSAGWPCGLDALRHRFGPHFDCNTTAKKAKVSLPSLQPYAHLILHICLSFFHTLTHYQVQVTAFKAGTEKQPTAAGMFHIFSTSLVHKGACPKLIRKPLTCAACKVTGHNWNTTGYQ